MALQTILIGPSGSAKSTAIREVQRIVSATDRAYYGQNYIDVKHDRWVPAEGTTAGILETLHDMYVENWDTPIASYQLNSTPVLLYSEELPVNLVNKQEGLKILLELFDPVPKVDRRLAKYRAMQKLGQKAPCVVHAPAVSAVFATTPATLEAVFETHHLDGGLSQRVLWAFARGDAERLTVDKPDHTAARQAVVADWVRALRWHDGMAMRGAAGDKLLPLTPAVKELLELQLAQAQEAHRAFNDRLVSIKVRGLNTSQLVAQVFAWSHGAYEVHPDDLDRAMNFIAACHKSFQEVSSLLSVNTVWLAAQKLQQVIEATGGLARSDCYKVLSCSKSELEAVLELLIDRGDIDRVRVPSTGGRPVERFLPKRAPTEKPETRGVVLPFVKPGVSEDAE